MKTAAVIGIGSLISMIFIAGAFFLLFSANPAAFGVRPQEPVKPVAAVSADSSKEISIDSSAAVRTDSKTVEARQPAVVAAAPVKKTEASKTIVFHDTTDWKSKAKLFEAMTIESASSILQTMNDKDVKLIIPYIKKRNAAKILATFDPDRAARIIR